VFDTASVSLAAARVFAAVARPTRFRPLVPASTTSLAALPYGTLNTLTLRATSGCSVPSTAGKFDSLTDASVR
jgi:hypothetical protein